MAVGKGITPLPIQPVAIRHVPGLVGITPRDVAQLEEVHVAGSNSDEAGDVPDSDGLYWSLGLGPQLMKLAKNLGTVWIYS